MPELPEVETIVNDLRPQLVGRRFESLQLTRDPAIRARLVRYPSANTFIRRLRGRTIMSIQRRGKYIVMPLDPAAAANNGSVGGVAASGERVIVHLAMTGHLRAWEPEGPPVKHTHLRPLLDVRLGLRHARARQVRRPRVRRTA